MDGLSEAEQHDLNLLWAQAAGALDRQQVPCRGDFALRAYEADGLGFAPGPKCGLEHEAPGELPWRAPL